KRMSQMVDARPFGFGLPSDRGGDPVEGRSHALGEQGGADARDAKGRRPWVWTRAAPSRPIRAERMGRALLERDEARPTALGLADREDTSGEIDVAPLETDCLPDPHAGRPKQSEQRLAGDRPKSRLELASSLHEPEDFGLFPQVGRRTLVAGAKYVVRWDLGLRVDRLQVTGEPAHHRQSVCPLNRLDALWELGEGHRMLRGERRHSGGLEVVGELREHVAVEPQSEAERTAQRQVVLDVAVKFAHRPAPPGQGCATVRSPSMSTRAYSAVEEIE